MKVTIEDTIKLVSNMLSKATGEGCFFQDDLGYTWIWNGERVYCVEAEIEFIENGEDRSQNGYGAFDIEDVEKEMVEGGYIKNWEDTNVTWLTFEVDTINLLGE